MRPLIEILEDERTLVQKQDAVYRYLMKTDDFETLEILNGQRKRVENDLEKVRNEMKEYITDLLK
jgi:hypothetical protein